MGEPLDALKPFGQPAAGLARDRERANLAAGFAYFRVFSDDVLRPDREEAAKPPPERE